MLLIDLIPTSLHGIVGIRGRSR